MVKKVIKRVFLSKYNDLYIPEDTAVPIAAESQTIGRTAQEVIAVSTYDITDHMIKHMCQQENITPDPDRRLLLGELVKLQEAVTPAYIRAASRVTDYYQEQLDTAVVDLTTPAKLQVHHRDILGACREAVHIVSERVKSDSELHADVLGKLVAIDTRIAALPAPPPGYKARKVSEAVESGPAVGDKRAREGEKGDAAASRSTTAGSGDSAVTVPPTSPRKSIDVSITTLDADSARFMSSPIRASSGEIIDKRYMQAVKMRAGLEKAEAESGSEVKYGELKRTMSPIRGRPFTR